MSTKIYGLVLTCSHYASLIIFYETLLHASGGRNVPENTHSLIKYVPLPTYLS